MPIFPGMYSFAWATRARAVASAVGVCLAVSGCVWKGGVRHATDRVLPQAWAYEPRRMRVYPSTRFVQDDQRPILEARIELTDEMGDSIKGVGRFRLELFARGIAGNPGVGQRLYSWDVSTTTLADQYRYYDPITRAYLFRLKLDEAITAQTQTVVQVMFISPQGKRLETQAVLPIVLGSAGSPG